MLELSGKGKIDRKEALRYLGYYGAADISGIESEVSECEKLILSVLTPKACLQSFNIKRLDGDGALDLGFTQTRSKSLAKNLEGCSKIVVFAATVGAGADRLVLKYGKLSPARSLILQALGAASVECWCDDVNAIIIEKYGPAKPRFSCGYGDLPLQLQRDIFTALNVTKRLGITLSDDLFMTPTKSVTAIVGIKD